jgi:hypothetical protein
MTDRQKYLLDLFQAMVKAGQLDWAEALGSRALTVVGATKFEVREWSSAYGGRCDPGGWHDPYIEGSLDHCIGACKVSRDSDYTTISVVVVQESRYSEEIIVWPEHHLLETTATLAKPKEHEWEMG